ncbi:MAG TPA: tRNA-dihydrouridine synthase [Candidatus Ozemobacteraceae bacterium]
MQPHDSLIHPLEIGGVLIPNNLVLAPMAGVADGPFRLVCSRLGAGLTVSELVSARGLLNENGPTHDLVSFSGQPRPYAVQIFGSNPDLMAEAARRVESLGICDIIDINMGCPVAKVVKTGAGAALMRDPRLAASIIRSVRAAVRLPVTVKCRIGWCKTQIHVQEFVRMAVGEGAAAVAVHARTKEAMYSGKAEWEHLAGLSEICGRIPFIANGDLSDREALHRVHEISGCDGFMIGRSAIGKPWIFAELTGRSHADTPEARHSIFLDHFLETLMEHGSKGVPLFRVHLFAYLRSHPRAAAMRRRLCAEHDPVIVRDLAAEFYLNRQVPDWLDFDLLKDPATYSSSSSGR